MSAFEEENGTRHRVRESGKKYYFTVTDKSIQFHAEKEGDLSLQAEYSQINTICRLVSKLRGLDMPWVDIVKQLDAGSMGNPRTWPGLMAQVIRDEYHIDQMEIGVG